MAGRQGFESEHKQGNLQVRTRRSSIDAISTLKDKHGRRKYFRFGVPLYNEAVGKVSYLILPNVASNI